MVKLGLLWDRNHDDGRGEIKKTEIPLDGSSMHVSQFDRENNTRTSWDTNGRIDGVEPGSQHSTNQNVGKHHPNRH